MITIYLYVLSPRYVRSMFSAFSITFMLTASLFCSAVEADERNDTHNQKTDMVQTPATVQAFFSTDLYAKESGYVSHINADIGDHVHRNQVLAVIEDPELQQGLEKAQAVTQQAKAIKEVAQQQLVSLQANLVLQQATLKRQEDLFAGKAVTDQQIDETRAKAQVSSADIEVGRAKIAAAEADIHAADSEVKRFQSLLQYTKVVAPFDCIVTRRLVNLGDLVQAATTNRTVPLFTCQQINVVRVLADIPEVNATSVRPGWIAEIKPSGEQGVVIHAKVTRIAKALDPATRTMRVEIDVPNSDEKLLPGMYAQVTLKLPSGLVPKH